MGRPRYIVPSQQLNLAVPSDLFARLSLHLYSELEQRIPHGAFSRFICEQIREHFAHRYLDLAPFLGSESGVLIVQGHPEAIEQLEQLLKERQMLCSICKREMEVSQPAWEQIGVHKDCFDEMLSNVTVPPPPVEEPK